MSTCCKGKIERDGTQWYCLDCGFHSSAWSTEHSPLQTKAAHFLCCFKELLQVTLRQVDVGAAQAA